MCILFKVPHLINVKLSNEPADGYWGSHAVDIPILGAEV